VYDLVLILVVGWLRAHVSIVKTAMTFGSALRATRQLVTGLIGQELRREELPAGTFGNLEQQEVLLARTADRSVLGGMNDMAFRCERAIAGAGGLARTDLPELNRSLRRNINSARGYCPPIELAARRLAV
jgi:hypothetical protein